MATNQVNLYIYLAKRDKSGMRLLARVLGKPILATRINDVGLLRLPTEWTTGLNQLIYDNRMDWEPFIEHANTYEELTLALLKRGYSNVPISPQPELSSSNLGAPTINSSSLPDKKVMLRKNGS